MAHFTKEMKSAIAPKIKALLSEYGMKGSLSVRNYSTVVLKIKSGTIDFGKDYINVNVYWVDQHYAGKPREFLLKALEILNTGNYDNSDIMSDYHDVGHYVDIEIGQWDRKYELVSA